MSSTFVAPSLIHTQFFEKMSETNAPAAAEVAAAAATAEVEEKKETATNEKMEVDGAPAADAPSGDDGSADEAPAAEKPKGKAKAPAKKKAAAPKKAAAAPKKTTAPRKAAAAAAAAAPASPVKTAVAAPKAKSPAAAKKPAAAKEAAGGSGSHPPYLEMIVAAVESLKERNGSSRQAILKYITSSYELGVDSKMANVHLKQALKRGVATGTLKNTKVTFFFFLFSFRFGGKN